MRESDGVEFMDDAVPTGPTPARTSLRIVLALAIVAVLVVATTLGRAHHHAVPAPPAPTAPVAESAVPDQMSASAILIAAFAQYLPGAAVTSERTVLQLDHANGTATFALRDVRVALGAVGQFALRIVPSTSAARLRPPTVRVLHAGYTFDFTFTGMAPLSSQLLRGLVADARLVAVGA